MNKRNVWTRAMAFMLAMVMILTSQRPESRTGRRQPSLLTLRMRRRPSGSRAAAGSSLRIRS